MVIVKLLRYQPVPEILLIREGSWSLCGASPPAGDVRNTPASSSPPTWASLCRGSTTPFLYRGVLDRLRCAVIPSTLVSQGESPETVCGMLVKTSCSDEAARCTMCT